MNTQIAVEEPIVVVWSSVLPEVEKHLKEGSYVFIRFYQGIFSPRYAVTLKSTLRSLERTADEACLISALSLVQQEVFPTPPCRAYEIMAELCAILKEMDVVYAQLGVERNPYWMKIQTGADSALRELPIKMNGQSLCEAIAKYIGWVA